MAEADTPIELDGPAWQQVMGSRRRWVNTRRAAGWTEDEIENVIMDYYAGGRKRNPFDFVKAEYEPTKRKDYYEMVRAREQRKIEVVMGKYF